MPQPSSYDRNHPSGFREPEPVEDGDYEKAERLAHERALPILKEMDRQKIRVGDRVKIVLKTPIIIGLLKRPITEDKGKVVQVYYGSNVNDYVIQIISDKKQTLPHENDRKYPLPISFYKIGSIKKI